MDDTVPRHWSRRAASSVRVRITAAATLVFAVTFTVGAFLLVGSVRSSLEDGLRTDNEAALAGLVDQIEAGEPAGDVIIGRADAASGIVFQVRTSDGRVVAGSGVGVGPITAPTVTGPGTAVARDPMAATDESGARLVETMTVETPEGPFTIEVASPLAGVRRSVDTIVDVLRVGMPLLTVLVGVLVWLLVRRALRPVDQLRREVDAISHGTLHRRLRATASDDEIGRLAGTMNDMLERLEGASNRQREFVSDASHELRSPLATMRTTIEVAPENPGAIDWDVLRHDLLAENRRMEELVTALLELARAGEVVDIAGAPVIDLADVVTEEVVRPREIDVRLGTVEDADVRGNRSQLARALRNLLDNAAQHGATSVEASLVVVGDAVRVVVDDDGPGIPRGERTRVFERFARLGDDRSRDDGGAGLGLAIVAATAIRHHGTVIVLDSPLGGARLVLELPAMSVPSAPVPSGGPRS